MGYNNGDMFIALFENCSRARAEGFVEIIKNEIPREDSEEDVFGFDYGIAETSQSGIYEIRKLLAQAIKNVNEDK